jgi:SAM-dependent methyltransferase
VRGTATPIGKAFRDVDRLPDHRRVVRYLDAQSARPFWDERKTANLQALELKAGDRVLDVGCGVGHDVTAISRRVGPEARSRHRDRPGVHFEVARGEALPFPSEAFDAVRTERTLQHVEGPERVVSEMVRVARAGGHISALEPDWSTLLIDSPDRNATASVCEAWVRQVRNPYIGRRLRGMLVEVGARDVAVEAHTCVITDLAFAEQQLELTRLAAETMPSNGARIWLEDLRRRDAAGRFFAAVTYVFGVGRK